MAKQSGIIPLLGTIGNITFLKTKDGYLAKGKTTISAKRIAADPAFQRTRENNAEFGRAGKAAKLIRTSVHSLLQNAKDPKVVSRLTKEMVRVVKSDSSDLRGQRTVVNGNITLLEGFDFNINAPLSSILLPQYTATVDRVAGTLQANIPAFIPANDIEAPEGTTHFSIVSAGAEADFAGDSFVAALSNSSILPWDSTATSAISLSNAVTAGSTKPLFLFLGIQFFQQTNGANYTLKNGTFNPLSIVTVSVP